MLGGNLREYNVDLAAPKMLYCGDDLVEALIRSVGGGGRRRRKLDLGLKAPALVFSKFLMTEKDNIAVLSSYSNPPVCCVLRVF